MSEYETPKMTAHNPAIDRIPSYPFTHNGQRYALCLETVSGKKDRFLIAIREVNDAGERLAFLVGPYSYARGCGNLLGYEKLGAKYPAQAIADLKAVVHQICLRERPHARERDYNPGT